jgi:quercetin 2,3-dioxygenase
MNQTQGIIYLSELRECFQTETFRSFTTLPNPNYAEPPFNEIVKFSDNTLVSQKSCQLLSDSDYHILLIPLVGAIEIKDAQKRDNFINAGELGVFPVKKGDTLNIQNPYEAALINYLEIWLKCEKSSDNGLPTYTFNLDNGLNQLIEITRVNQQIRILMGKFGGRMEGELPCQDESKVFVFVINGAFEVQNRLVEARSALALWDVESLDFEGLAPENIILILSF